MSTKKGEQRLLHLLSTFEVYAQSALLAKESSIDSFHNALLHITPCHFYWLDSPLQLSGLSGKCSKFPLYTTACWTITRVASS